MLARLFITSAIFGALIWAIVDIQSPRADRPIDFVAESLIGGDAFPAYELRQWLEQNGADETDCRSGRSRNVAIVSMALFDAVRHERLPHADQLALSAKDKIIRSLQCSPSDPFLWLGLFETETSNGRASQAGLNYLRESFRLGPNEGWIMTRRARLASPFLMELPPDLSSKVSGDLVSLVEHGYWGAPTDILLGTAPGIRKQMIAALDTVRPTQLRLFARHLRDKGVAATELPWADRFDTQRDFGYQPQ